MLYIPMSESDTRWLMVLVPFGAWATIELLRRLGGYESRSAVAEAALRQATSIPASQP